MAGRASPPPPALREEAQRLYGVDPVGYESGRPDYPERVYEVLTSRCGLTRGTETIEIGPGTGRATRRLLELGAGVVGVEPDAQLAAYLSRQPWATATEVIASTFEEALLPEAAFDLAVAAMSFHWVDQGVGLPKLSRILRPNGWVALWWTVFGDPTRQDPFHEATADLLGKAIGPDNVAGKPLFELELAERCHDLQRLGGFEDAEGELIRWAANFSPSQLRSLYASMIRVLRLPDREREQLLDALEATARDDFGGAVQRPFVTALYTARRR